MSYFIVPMFPYPSGYFHMGHARNYIFSDIIKRFLEITQIDNSYHCLGIDAFGLPAENASKRYGIKPNNWTNKNIQHIIDSLEKLNISYNKNTWINTSEQNFIRLNQFIFQILLENNLIYRSEKYVNWDPEDMTILSNEQIINNRGWRSGAIIQKKIMKSWYVRISEYSEFLKNELKTINWPKQIKKIQNKWIDKINGYIIKFSLINTIDLYKDIDAILCFTKKPECCFNAKFIAISYTHELAIRYIKANNISINNDELNDLCIKTDITCINSYNNKILPVYIAGYVISNFATMALYGAPNLDEKDFNFAKKAGIDVNNILENTDLEKINLLKKNNIIYPISIYTLNDWCISRQRIWGCPIPIIYCDVCGPQVFIDDEINNKRLSYDNFKLIQESDIKILCKNGHSATLDIETLDTFFDSSWYYLCYLDNVKLPYIKDINSAKEFLIQRLKKLPINFYIGGIEHANLHLIYTRAIIAMLHRCLGTNYIIPIETLITQGSILHKSYLDKNNKYIDGSIKEDICTIRLEKMSKSKLNTISIYEMLQNFDSDTIRFAIMSNMPIDVSYEWDNKIFYSKDKFLKKLIYLLNQHSFSKEFILNNISVIKDNFLNKNIIYIYVSEDIYNKHSKYINYMENYKIHNAIAIIHELFNSLKECLKINNKEIIIDEYIATILLTIYPISPNIASKYLYSILDINNKFIYEIKYR